VAKATAACQTERGDGFPERRDSASNAWVNDARHAVGQKPVEIDHSRPMGAAAASPYDYP